MRRILLMIVVVVLAATTTSFSQIHKKRYPFPATESYLVLKCDFHIHTIYSDGQVMPDTRVIEAWEEDLDVISLTEHAENQSFDNEVTTANDLNRSYDMAKDKALQFGITLIRGTEISRDMPPGHLNAIGIKDANKLKPFMNKNPKNKRDTLGFWNAVVEARRQGAFILWNHPAYPETDKGIIMHPIHKKLYEHKLLDGIEVVNGECYLPEAFGWCQNLGISIISNTDVHTTMSQKRKHDKSKTMTLVLAKSKSEEDVMEALFAGRTAAVWRDNLYGNEEVVSEIVKSALKLRVKGYGKPLKGIIEMDNNCGMPFTVRLVKKSKNLEFWGGQSMILNGMETAMKEVTLKGKEATITLEFLNVFTEPNKNLILELPVEIL